MILHPSPISTDALTYEPSSRSFHAEISDLGRAFRFGRVYDDACDVGLTLISARSGKAVVFAVTHESRDGEGEVQGWTLKPVSPGAADCTLVLIND